MASYIVMEPPSRGAEDAVLVRDGFHIVALILPVVWLLYHRLWIEALAVLVAGLLLGTLGSWFGLGATASAGSLMLAVFVGLEASAMKIAALRRRGWREWGVVEADNAGDAEIRYLSGQDDIVRPGNTTAPAPAQTETARYGRRPEGPALGLLGYPAKG